MNIQSDFKSIPDLPSETGNFVAELDAAVESHLKWTRRVLRCVALRESPGEDVLAPLAHTLCHFGSWFVQNKVQFEKLNAPNTRRIDAVHQTMHDNIRAICADVLAGRSAKSTDLEAFEQTQSELFSLLAGFKTQFLNINKNITKRLNAIIHAKGGSGASFIASNVAYILSKDTGLKVALVDLDLQFGSIGLNFNITPNHTIMEALNAIEDLDSISLEAYMSKYNENLSLLLPSPADIVLPGEVNVSDLKKLLELLQINYDQMVVDLPRVIDPVSIMIMEQADQITLVLQQSVDQFRVGCRLIQTLNEELDIPLDKISIVVNRYNPKNSLRIEDLKNIVKHDNVYIIANDFERAEGSSNLGVPLYESSANSQTALDLKELTKNLGGVEFESGTKNVFGRLRSFLSSD
ncbi:MAG: AAA family ATPase [Methylobacter sp.]|jgi:Flp pilus assembly CpaE family ATPase|nr:AAA family ATPase [Methylobacter sp.]